MGKFITYESAFHISSNDYNFFSVLIPKVHTEKIDAGFEPLQRWKKCVLCTKYMPWCYFCCSEKYCHLCIAGFWSRKWAAVARRSSQQKAIGKLETKVCGFGMTEYLQEGGEHKVEIK